jgi:chemotaxis protein MotB
MPVDRNQRPIVIKRVRKAGHAAHHGGAWKVAYADFVTAMMAFFMLLWLIANPDKVRLKGLAEYFSVAPPIPSPSTTMTAKPGSTPGLGGRTRRAQADSPVAKGEPASETGSAGVARGGTAEIPDVSQRVLAVELQLVIDSSTDIPDAASQVRILSSRDGLRIDLMDSDRRSMFRSGTADLNPFARALLARVAAKLARAGTQIALEGHTDAAGGASEANWRLSADRALAARSVMAAAGIAPDRFEEIVALAGSRPVYPDQPNRPENRRITIVALAGASALPSDASFAF